MSALKADIYSWSRKLQESYFQAQLQEPKKILFLVVVVVLMRS